MNRHPQPPQTEIGGILLDTDIVAAVEEMERKSRRPHAPAFTLAANAFRKIKAADAASRRGIRAKIVPENARGMVEHLPATGERTHCILRGDFVLCDVIPAIIRARGHCPYLRIAQMVVFNCRETHDHHAEWIDALAARARAAA